MGDEEVAVKLPTKDEITSGLSQVTRTTDGTGWAMAKLDLSEKELSGQRGRPEKPSWIEI